MSKVRVKIDTHPATRTTLKREVEWRRRRWIFNNNFNGATIILTALAVISIMGLKCVPSRVDGVGGFDTVA